MSLYLIDQAIAALVDPTGEILDLEAFEALAMERDKLIENMICWYKNELADAEALKAEEKALAERRKKHEAKAAKLERYIAEALDGQAFESPKGVCSFTKSTGIVIDDEKAFVQTMLDNGGLSYLTAQGYKPNRKAIKLAINLGIPMPGATIEERNNITIK